MWKMHAKIGCDNSAGFKLTLTLTLAISMKGHTIDAFGIQIKYYSPKLLSSDQRLFIQMSLMYKICLSLLYD